MKIQGLKLIRVVLLEGGREERPWERGLSGGSLSTVSVACMKKVQQHERKQHAYGSILSAKSQMRELMYTPISLMYTRNNKCPNTVLCETPDITVTGADFSPFTYTVCSLQQSQASIHFFMAPGAPYRHKYQ